jgi:phage-related protein
VAEQAYAYVTLIPVAKGFQQAVAKEMGGVGSVGEKAGQDVGGGMSKGFGKGIAGVAALVAGAFSVRALTNFAKESILAAEAVSTANARIDAVAKATGVFGTETDAVTKRVQEFAKAQEMRIAVDDTVIKGVQAQLLTFKELSSSAGETGGVFDRVTLAAFDMAQVVGTADGNAIALGKALEDPTKGLTALARGGTVFTEQQKEQIKTLQESGDLLGAQELILAEVESQYGGLAEASADASDKLNLAFGNIKEAVGDQLLPIFADLVDQLLPVIDEVIPVLGQTIEALSPVIKDLAGQLPGLLTSLFPLIPIIGEIAGIFFELAAQLLPIIVQLFDALMPTIAELLPVLADFIGEAMQVLVPLLMELIGALMPIVTALLPVFMELFEALAPVAITLIKSMLPIIDRLLPMFIEFVEFLTPLLVWLGELLGDILVGALNFLVGAFEEGQIFFDQFGKFFQLLWYGIQSVFVSVINGLITGFENFVNFFIDGFNKFVQGINVVRKALDLVPLELAARISLGRLDEPTIPALAEGGVVTGPTTALIGEAGPEMVIPLDRFESMLGERGDGRTINYYAAPNKSFDAEQELRLAMTRARVLA